jgi:hypothetical protein
VKIEPVFKDRFYAKGNWIMKMIRYTNRTLNFKKNGVFLKRRDNGKWGIDKFRGFCGAKTTIIVNCPLSIVH